MDLTTRRQLVVERKSLIWPKNYSQLHATSHDVSEIIEAEISKVLDPTRAYRLMLRDDLRGSRVELSAYRTEVARLIKSGIDEVHRGVPIRSPSPEDRAWCFCEESEYERDFTEPSTGLICEFSGPSSELDYGDVCDGLVSEFERLSTAASKKFEKYGASTRVLVIDPYADVRWSTPETWRELLEKSSIPLNIDEIWMSMHAMITELRCGRIHMQLWPTMLKQTIELCADQDAEA